MLSSFANNSYDLEDFFKIFLGINPDGELWFLYALFFAIAVLIIFDNKVSFLGLSLSATLAIIDLHTQIFPLKIFWFLFFFTLGIFARNNYRNFVFKFSFLWTIIFLMLFIVGNYFLIHSTTAEVRILTSISGILIVLQIAQKMSEMDFGLTKMFQLFGIFSMDLYILSDIIKIPFRILFLNYFHLYVTTFLICTFFSIVGSLMFSKCIIRKNKFLSKMILGLW